MTNIFPESKKSASLCLVAAICLCVPFTVLADDAATGASETAKVTESVSGASGDAASTKGIKVFVTASRGVGQDPLDVPQSTATITRENLDDTVYDDVHDAIQELPNIGLAPSEGNPNFWQQGFSIRGLGAQRVLTLSDGVRQAGQGIGYGGGNLSLYDVYGIDSIELIRGPASVLYGTDAFGGVINIITRSPLKRDTFGMNAGTRYSFDSSRDLNRVGGYLDFGDKGYAAIFGGSYTNSGQPNLPDGVDPHSGSYRNLGYWGKTDFFFSQDTKLRVFGNVDRNMDVLIDDESITLPIATFPPPGSSEMITSPLYFSFPVYQRSLLGTEVTSENIDPNFEFFKSGFYWQQIYRRFHRESAFYPTFSPGFAGPPTFVDPNATVTRSETDTRDRVNTFEWQTQARFNYNPHVLTVGTDLAYDTAYLPETEIQQVAAVAGIGSQLGMPTSTDRLRADAHQYRVGLYAQDSWDLKPFELTPGVRFDYINVENNNTNFTDHAYGISGSVGTVYHQNERQSLYMNLATGFRAPDLGERFQNGIVNLGAPSRVIGNEDLDPEHSYSAEWGLKRRDGRLNSDFAVFINHITDFIGTTPIGPSEGFLTDQFDNLGTVNLYGGEYAGRYYITKEWSVYGNAGRTWTNEGDIVDVANWAFNYGTEYLIPVNVNYLQSVTAGVNVRTMLDPKDKPAKGGRQPYEAGGFTVVDLKLNLDIGKTPLGKGSIVSGIRNLFNRSYEEPFFPQLQPERSVFVAVQLDY